MIRALLARLLTPENRDAVREYAAAAVIGYGLQTLQALADERRQIVGVLDELVGQRRRELDELAAQRAGLAEQLIELRRQVDAATVVDAELVDVAGDPEPAAGDDEPAECIDEPQPETDRAPTFDPELGAGRALLGAGRALGRLVVDRDELERV